MLAEKLRVRWATCELPFAVGVRKNTAHSNTGCQRKQSKDRSYQAFFRVHLNYEMAWNRERPPEFTSSDLRQVPHRTIFATFCLTIGIPFNLSRVLMWSRSFLSWDDSRLSARRSWMQFEMNSVGGITCLWCSISTDRPAVTYRNDFYSRSHGSVPGRRYY